MKPNMKKAASLTLAAALVVTSVFCGGNDAQAAVKAKKITMNKKKVNITVGGKFTLKVKKVTPKKANKAVKYKSSNKKIASVSKKGVVKGKKAGTATITVTSKSNKKVKATVKVTVKDKKQQTTPVVSQPPVATATPVVTPAPGSDVTSAPLGTSGPDVTNQPATKTPTQKPVKTAKPPTAPPTEKPKAEEPADEVLDVMAISELDIAEGITKTDNEDGSVTLDFTGTSYKGARWYFVDGDKTETVKNEDGEEVTRGVRKPLNLEKYTYVVVEGVNQEGVKLEAVEGNPDKKKGHDLSAQFLDALDHASHGGLLEIETQANMFFPIKFNLADDNRVNVAAFEIYSLGDAASKKAGPITVTSIKAYKDKAAYDKLTASPSPDPDTSPSPDPDTSPSPDPDTSPSPDPDDKPAPDFTAAKIASDASIVVDGDGNDDAWTAVPELAIENVVLQPNAEVETASTATAKIAWDENNLYGLVKVTDPNVSLSAGASHERDGVEFFLDEDYSMDADFAVNTDAFQYRLTGLEKDGDGVKAALTNEIAGGSADAKTDYAGITTAYSITDDGYVVEFKIPFKAAKKAGDRVGFDIIVQDCTGEKRAAEIYLRKTDKALSYWNLKDTFATLELSE